MTAINPENVTFLVKQFDDNLPRQKPSQDFNSPYNDKVLCGNWQENLRSYVRRIYPMASEYMKEYYHPSVHALSKEHYYDNKLKGWGTDWHTVNDQGLPEEYLNNFSTLYDLAYNGSCPKVVNKPWRKFHGAFAEYRPQQDMMNNFGNTVNYGLTKYKEEQWEDQKVKHIGDATTTYQVTYIPKEIQPRSKKDSFHRRNVDKKTTGKKSAFSDHPQTIAMIRNRRPRKILPSL
ncbi:uncharacterized protein [Halyomorpha halys]|uniref:uncharacterized protein n=1 Tax=Halyomorpha halys TaxID=286706 RepID=UPI0006D51787|nr:uncharacterized protein LOC106678362 [Halyomorpha halys]